MLLNIFQLCILTILVFPVFMLLKYSIQRQNYSNIVPCLKLRFTNVVGHLNCFPFSYSKTGWNGYSATTYLMELLKAFCYIFKNEHIALAWIGYAPILLLNSPEAVKELLSGTKALEKSVIYNWLHCSVGDGLVTSHGKKWKSRRKQMTRAFHFDMLKNFLPIMNENSQKLVKILEKDTTKDFTNTGIYMQLCTLDITCNTILGVNINAQENRTSKYVKALVHVTDALALRFLNVLSWFDFTYFLTSGRDVKKDIEFLQGVIKSIIQEKKEKYLNGKMEKADEFKHKPLTDLLLELQIDKNELTDEDILEEVNTFSAASQDTTSIALTWACYLTGLHKDIQAKAHEEVDAIFGDDRERHVTSKDLKEMKYLECIIKESLRIYPPVPSFARNADKDMIICGYQIPENSTLVVIPYMLHRNEDIFPNPEKFDPDRFTSENSKNRHPYAYIPFSAGPRNCLGQKYAMMSIKTVFSHILRHYTLESLDPRDKVVDCFEITLRPTKDVRIKIRPRDVNATRN